MKQHLQRCYIVVKWCRNFSTVIWVQSQIGSGAISMILLERTGITGPQIFYTSPHWFVLQGPRSLPMTLPTVVSFRRSVDPLKGNRESYWGCWSHHSWISNRIQKEFEIPFTRNGSDIAIQSAGSWLEFYAAQQPWRFCKVSLSLHYMMPTYRSEPVETAFFVVSTNSDCIIT